MAEVSRRPVAVIDSNVLWPETLRHEIVDAAYAGLYTPVWSDWIVAEVWRILTQRWIVKQRHDPRRLGSAAKNMMRTVAPVFVLTRSLPSVEPAAWPSLGDPDDEPIWTTAINANADFVVSMNTDDFPPPDSDGRNRWEGVEYLEPPAFLELIGWVDEGDGEE